ncbi:MAG: hypothetical protein IPJ77_17800 [Planctomycetes bacterium]|nr:hypothetical protein [Planctomycetota bacterium]
MSAPRFQSLATEAREVGAADQVEHLRDRTEVAALLGDLSAGVELAGRSHLGSAERREVAQRAVRVDGARAHGRELARGVQLEHERQRQRGERPEHVDQEHLQRLEEARVGLAGRRLEAELCEARPERGARVGRALHDERDPRLLRLRGEGLDGELAERVACVDQDDERRRARECLQLRLGAAAARQLERPHRQSIEQHDALDGHGAARELGAPRRGVRRSARERRLRLRRAALRASGALDEPVSGAGLRGPERFDGAARPAHFEVGDRRRVGEPEMEPPRCAAHEARLRVDFGLT